MIEGVLRSLTLPQRTTYAEAYTAPFQYGAQVRDSNSYKVHQYIDQQKLAVFEHPYQTSYPTIDIDLKYFKILCQDSDDINLGDINGQTVLHALCLYGSINSLKIVIDTEGDIAKEDYMGFAVAHYCAISNRVDLLKYLDNIGANLTKECLTSGRSPLQIACICDSLDVVKYLISRGVEYKMLDNNGYSPMWLAMFYRNNDICSYLFDYGGMGTPCNVDRINFLFRTFDKCDGLGSKMLDRYITECKYRNVDCIWLNKMVDGNSYFKSDLTYPFLYVSNIKDKFIEHTFIKSFISVAWKKFGRKAAGLEIVISLIYSLLWTLFYLLDDGESMKNNTGRICLYVMLVIYVGFMIFWGVRRLLKKSKANIEFVKSENNIIYNEFASLHPCMFQAKYVLSNEKRKLLSKKTTITSLILLGHQLVDSIVHILSLIVLILDFIQVFTISGDSLETQKIQIQRVYIVVSACVLILVWMTCLNKIRLLRTFGSFLILILQIGKLLAKFACFYIFLYIPIACVFWKSIYQYSYQDASLQNITGLDAFYRVYRMTFSDYSYDTGLEIATNIGMPSWWDILVLYWITVGGLVLLNVLGGLVYSVLAQPIQKSRIIAQKERLWFLCEVVMLQSNEQKVNFARFLEMDCNPYVIEKKEEGGASEKKLDVEKELKKLRTELDAFRERFQNDNEPSSSSLYNP